MSQILVRNLSPETVERLKDQAKRHNRSLEAEVRQILDAAAGSNRIRSPEYQAFEDEIAGGRNKIAAFRDYIEKTRTRVPAQTTDSTDIARQARDELDAKAHGDLRR